MIEFERNLKEACGSKIMDDEFATEVWGALANVDWYNPQKNLKASYSFRAAGGLIAEMRGEGDYMDWYCSGPYAIVNEYIAMSMKKLGWIADTLPSVCDEPKCIKAAECCSSIDGKYRVTCYEHSGFNKEKE